MRSLPERGLPPCQPPPASSARLSPPLSPQLCRCPPAVAQRVSTEREHDRSSEVRVRLTLTPSDASLPAPPGVQVADCGDCSFCLDKPRFGGPGRKRQKCNSKRISCATGETRVWAAVQVITQEEIDTLQMFMRCPLPTSLVEAVANSPLPVVWGFRRPRRARTLPPAFVLMYHCDTRIPLDKSFLNDSIADRYKGVRQAAHRVSLVQSRLAEHSLGWHPSSGQKKRPRGIYPGGSSASSEAGDPSPTELGAETEGSEQQWRTPEAADLLDVCDGPLKVESCHSIPKLSLEDDLVHKYTDGPPSVGLEEDCSVFPSDCSIYGVPTTLLGSQEERLELAVSCCLPISILDTQAECSKLAMSCGSPTSLFGSQEEYFDLAVCDKGFFCRELSMNPILAATH